MKISNRSALSCFLFLGSASLSSGMAPKIGLNEIDFGAQYLSASVFHDPTKNEFGIQTALNASLLNGLLSSGNIFPGMKDFRLRIADLEGANISGDFSPLFVDLGIIFGVQAVYAVTDKLDVGIKYYYDLRNYFYDPGDPSITLRLNTPAVMARYGSFFGDAAFGFGSKPKTNSKSALNDAEDYTSMTFDARYYMSAITFVGLRLDLSTNKFDGTGRKDDDLMATLQFGLGF